MPLQMRLTCAISPDADDRFMFRAITERRIDLEGLTFDVVNRDTDQLNRMATGDGPHITAISIAHYPAIAQWYRLLNHGGSVGRNYGPVVVVPAGSPIAVAADLRDRRIAVPGLTTTACLVLRLITPFEPVVVPIVPPERTFEALASGEVDAALIIHEGRLTFPEHGCRKVLDIGEWWHGETGLPLPLGGNVLRRDVPSDVAAAANRVLRASIAHALADRAGAIDWLIAGGTVLKRREQVDQYLSLYANADTLDYGEDGRAGIRVLLRRGAEAGWIPAADAEFVRG